MAARSVQPAYGARDLDLELVFDRFLDDTAFDVLQQQLSHLLPEWSANLRVWRSRDESLPIDLDEAGSLGTVVTSAATSRGPLYHRLVARSGPPLHDRRTGSAELRGASPALTMVISIDEAITSRIGPQTKLGNRITFQVRRASLEGRSGTDWARAACMQLCTELQPAWASACHPREYWDKVMSETPSVQAVGRDFGRYLPGLFWLNGFGPPFARLIGRERLIATPATEVVVCGDVIVVVRGDGPGQWDEPATVAVEDRIIEHLGQDLFFSKAAPDRSGRVPDWGAG